jgi:hypothetical protein
LGNDISKDSEYACGALDELVAMVPDENEYLGEEEDKQ